ncbi:MAG: phage integrase SAM-like domain-containing protein [Candidatus Omnitrophica bacterium]|nr:phage integrase SAM-like domain-containing protein [Candidatus Omnitrophota bacterium]
MGSVYQLGDVFYIEFEARGLKYQQLAGSSEIAARALLETIEEKIRQSQLNMVDCNVFLETFWLNFNNFALNEYPLATTLRLDKAIRHFNDFLNARHKDILFLSSVTPQVIEEYKFFILKNGAKPWQFNFTLVLLKEVFDYAIKEGYLNDNPTLHIRYANDNRKCVVKNKLAHAALAKGVSLFRLAQLLRINDVLRVMPFFSLARHPLQSL